jgi:hypothetical protein
MVFWYLKNIHCHTEYAGISDYWITEALEWSPLEKLLPAQTSGNSPSFKESEESVPSSQDSATGSYPEPDESTPHSFISRYRDWLRAGRPRGRSSSPGRGKISFLSTSSRPVLGPTQPPIQWVQGALSTEVKRPEHEADHSPASNADVKNTWIYTYTPPYVLMALCLIS